MHAGEVGTPTFSSLGMAAGCCSSISRPVMWFELMF